MSSASVDTYAAVNPAFCSLVLRAFVDGYCKVDARGASLPLSILPLPLVLTSGIAESLASTNVTTGLLPWTTRSQPSLVGLSERVEVTAEFSKRALLFAVRYSIL